MRTIMSKRAEQRALEEYPILIIQANDDEWDDNEDERCIYQEGYQHAEKETIERSCEWLSRNYDIDLARFRKAIEEE